MNATKGWTQEPDSGDIFHEDFRSDKLTNWKDMTAWGFGVWQIKNGKLISVDPREPEKGIVAILPDFKNNVVNRDFSVLLHFKPVLKKDILFIIDFRHQGVNNYRLEIDKKGRISIVKNLVSHLPRKLFETAAEKVKFDQWQWLRLDVRGEKPVRIGAKVWQGELSDESEFYSAFAAEAPGLTPENLNFALTMMQSGGSRVEIDSFDIFSKVPPQKIWRWHSGTSRSEKKICQDAKRFFRECKLQQAKMELLKISASVAGLNNLAIIAAERGEWNEANELIHQAKKLAPADEIIAENAKWIWYSGEKGGPVAQETKNFGIIQVNKAVFLHPETAQITFSANKSFFEEIRENVHLKIKIENIRSKESKSLEGISQFDKTGEIRESQMLNLADFADGEYEISALLADGIREFPFEKVKFEVRYQDFGKLAKRFDKIKVWLKSRKSSAKNLAEKNDLANVEVLVLRLNQQMSDCDAPGNFLLYQDKIETALQEAEKIISAMDRGENPFKNQNGTFMRGYYSQIDGSVQGYALFVPEKYQEGEPFPLVVNLHGYDPSFSSWWENIFLPIFMPYTIKGGRYIVVNPFGRGNTMYQNLGEQDVLAVISEVKRLYSIDENRIYLTGGSMGGGGTWHLGLTHADMFTALAPIMGPTEFAFWLDFPYQSAPEFRKFLVEQRSPLFYAENALHLPIFCNHGVQDDIVPIEQSRKIVERLRKLGYNIRYVEHPEAAHGGFDPKMDEEIYDWFENLQRDPAPKKIVLKAGDLNHASAYWLEITCFADIQDFAQIEALAKNSTIEISTKNVARFKVKLNLCPEEISQNTIFLIDGQEIRADSKLLKNQIEFSKEVSGERSIWKIFSEKAEEGLQKRKGIASPFVDVFNDGFVLIYGTIGSQKENQVNFAEAKAFQNQWKKWQHVPCRIKSDREIDDEDMRQLNLILFGSSKSNLIAKKVIAGLPVEINENEIQFGNELFSGKDLGIAMVYPNPLNQDRYLALFAGTSWRAVQGCTRRIGMDFDYQIYDGRTLGIHILQGNLTVDGTPLLCGFFDQDWQISEKYQWRADESLREKIVPKKFGQSTPESKGKIAFLGDLKPDSIFFWTGEIERDRSFWGQKFQIGEHVFEKGLGLFPPVTLAFQLNGDFEKFSAIFAAEMNPFWDFQPEKYDGGKIQLAVYGDGEELFVSPAIEINSAPVSVEVPIAGVKNFVLKIRTQDWLPKFVQAASLIDARLTRKPGGK